MNDNRRRILNCVRNDISGASSELVSCLGNGAIREFRAGVREGREHESTDAHERY